MSEYSKEDREEFARKDLRMCNMNCLSHATQIVLAQKGTADVKDIVTFIKEVASDLVGFVYGQTTQPKVIKPVDTGEVIPIPTVDQQHIIDLIAEQLNKTTVDELNILKLSILEWANQKVNKRVYPTKEKSITDFLTWYNSAT